MHFSISSIVLALLCSMNSFGTKAQVVVSGRIVGANSEAVPFATIGIPKYNIGTVAFEDGSFSLLIEQVYRSDSVIISAVGYEQKWLAVEVLLAQSVIKLLEKVTDLETVEVRPGEYKTTFLGSGRRKSGSNFSVVSANTGISVAALFNEMEEEVWIDEIEVAVGKENIDSFLLRCRVFGVKPDGITPSVDLLGERLILEGNMKKESLVFKLSDPIWTDEPFYVGFEWVMTRKQKALIEKNNTNFNLDKVTDKRLIDAGLEPVINGRSIRYFDKSGAFIKEQALSNKDRALLKKRAEANPRVFFQSEKNGSKTIYGSYISGEWTSYNRSMIVGVRGRKKKK